MTPPAAAPRQIVSLWVGGALGPIERLSLSSFVANGHPVALYTYGEVRDVPDGVELRDAETIVPRALADAHRYPNGSYALVSNYFRFLLQRFGLGLWVDTDVVCLRPITLSGFVAGWESDVFVNGAVLGMDSSAPALNSLITAYEGNRLPDWIPFHRAPLAWLQRQLDRPVPPYRQPHGTYGPKGITATCEQFSLLPYVQPTDVFYPLHPRNAESLYAPGGSLETLVTENTLTVHLWNEKLHDLKRTTPPRESILGALLQRYQI
ncbi:hypothetical protein [Devosia sp.]|uniref:hypothetical protein n=1 Tax=Devosia sp. TaxID=1871048 RepID=UPI003A957571